MRIDRIAARLGLSKGSFFHHFDGIAAYRRALLERWESTAVRDLGDEAPQALLEDLAARVGSLVDLRLEVAIRAWAFHDPEAAAAQERVDLARLAALEAVWGRMVDDPDRAHTAALIPHLLVIGASVALPATSKSDLEAVFGMLAEVIPSVRSESTAQPASRGSDGTDIGT